MLSAPSATAVERPARSADGGCVSGLEDELRQLAVQRATIDDLSFAYQLQLEEVLRASAENAGLAVSPRMFAPESEECLQRRAAVEAQVSLQVPTLILLLASQQQPTCSGLHNPDISWLRHFQNLLAGRTAQCCSSCTSRQGSSPEGVH